MFRQAFPLFSLTSLSKTMTDLTKTRKRRRRRNLPPTKNDIPNSPIEIQQEIQANWYKVVLQVSIGLDLLVPIDFVYFVGYGFASEIDVCEDL